MAKGELSVTTKAKEVCSYIKHYVRYMDDGILIHEDKEYLKNAGSGWRNS